MPFVYFCLNLNVWFECSGVICLFPDLSLCQISYVCTSVWALTRGQAAIPGLELHIKFNDFYVKCSKKSLSSVYARVNKHLKGNLCSCVSWDKAQFGIWPFLSDVVCPVCPWNSLFIFCCLSYAPLLVSKLGPGQGNNDKLLERAMTILVDQVHRGMQILPKSVGWYCLMQWQ